jgi:hypothetical protein
MENEIIRGEGKSLLNEVQQGHSEGGALGRVGADSSSAKLNQLVDQLESEIGYSGRTLYQVLSEYLALKARHPELSFAIQGLEISSPDQMSPLQFEKNRELLAEFQNLRGSVYAALKACSPEYSQVQSLEEHPWRWFVHSALSLESESLETLLRVLRMALIQLNKFRVEVQSCPLFLNLLNQLSLPQTEEILTWIHTSADWADLSQHGRLVPALVQPQSRKVLMDFRRDVKSARLLKQRLSSQLEQYGDPKQLGSIWSRVQFKGLSDQTPQQVQATRDQQAVGLSKMEALVSWVEQLHASTGVPLPGRISEYRQFFKAMRLLQDIPDEVLVWRTPAILAAGQSIKLRAWAERAQQLKEQQKQLEKIVLLSQVTDPESLRQLAQSLTAGGLFRKFRSEHKNAERVYQDLLRSDTLLSGSSGEPSGQIAGASASNPASSSGPSENCQQKAQRLLEWASYLDQKMAFEAQEDLKSVFGSLFQGVDTHFEAALRANTWADQLRQDLQSNRFGQTLVEFISQSPSQAFQPLLEQAASGLYVGFELLLGAGGVNPAAPSQLGVSLANEVIFKESLSQIRSQVSELQLLLDDIRGVGVRSEFPLKEFEELKLMSEELQFLTHQMETNSELRLWLKHIYVGPETDITLIERGAHYVKFIEDSRVPEALKISFLSLHGPQRFNESKAMISSCLGTLKPLKEQLSKLNLLTAEKVKPLQAGPLIQFIHGVSEALKHSLLLEDYVKLLKLTHRLRALGLGEILDFFETKGGVTCSVRLDLAYEMALDASVLKKKMAGRLFQEVSELPAPKGASFQNS